MDNLLVSEVSIRKFLNTAYKPGHRRYRFKAFEFSTTLRKDVLKVLS